MKARNPILLAGATAIVLAGCRSDDVETAEPEVLPAVEEMELVTPEEAAWRAEAEITEANVDAAYLELLAEIEAEED